MEEELTFAAEALPLDVLESVALLLGDQDRISMASVCQAWRQKLNLSKVVWVDATIEVRDDPAAWASLTRWLRQRPFAQARRLSVSKPTTPPPPNPSALLSVMRAAKGHCDKLETLVMGRFSGVASDYLQDVAPKLAMLVVEEGEVTFSREFSANSRLEDLVLKVGSMQMDAACLPLSLRRMRLTGVHLASGLPKCMSQLTSLTSLVLESVQTRATGWGQLDVVFNGMPWLKLLDIQSLHAEGWPTAVTKLTALTELDIKLMNLWDAEDASIAALKNLQQLNLRKCSLEGLPQGTLELPNLTSLLVGSSPGMHFPEGPMTQLRFLDINADVLAAHSVMANVRGGGVWQECDLQLERIMLVANSIQISAANVLDIFALLRSMKRLRKATVYFDSLVIHPGVASQLVALARERPEVEIDFEVVPV